MRPEPTTYFFFNETRRCLIADNSKIANNFFTRLKGLLGTKSLESGKGLFIIPCSQIHMFGMKYPIDVVFIDKSNNVVGLVERIAPGRVSPSFRKSVGCLELPAGTISATGTALGDVVRQGIAPYAKP